jgi:hypothetical protein
MVTVPTDAEATGVVAMPTAALPEEAVASMAANPAAAVSTVAAVTLPEATVPEVTVAEATVADTGKNSSHGEVSTAGSTALPAIFFSRGQPPHPDFHFHPATMRRSIHCALSRHVASAQTSHVLCGCQFSNHRLSTHLSKLSS